MPNVDEEALSAELEGLADHERITINDDESWSMELTKPLELISGELTNLRFKPEMTVADLEEGDKAKGDVAQGARLIASMTNVSFANIRKLRVADFKLAGMIVAKLSGKGDETGGTS
jgi:hypothetical protein